jgi:hypothetical protein
VTGGTVVMGIDLILGIRERIAAAVAEFEGGDPGVGFQIVADLEHDLDALLESS